MPYNRKACGIVISRMRVGKGFSQEVLSGLAGISRSHLAQIEGGRKTMRLDTFWQIAEALAVTPDRLIRMIEEEIQNGEPP